MTTDSKIHGAGSVIGFMVFLFVPLLLGLLSFRRGERSLGILSIISFIIGFISFVLFIMADKPTLQGTWVAKEGLWQRVNLFFLYLPLAILGATNLS